ncbi:hypothetical protein [Desulfoplanes formicivorans]|uniref:Uncharacterized protein n=1 Tax=Desulfoplanes formicivorans TaxID=1592317 RepID=A0A194AG15_9BACT|nr:hypothetical protein [Desulfoplanes formicivorans]GAU08145.1 hypothetical protein DPF_0848 [Desulfoplanes formicivorans]
MRVIEPIDIELIDSNVTQSGLSEWDAETIYAAGQRVVVSYEEDGETPRVAEEYTSLRSDNVGFYPPDSSGDGQDGVKISVGDSEDVSSFTIGETVGTSLASGTCSFIDGTTGGYMILSGVSGDFDSGDTISGNDSGASATISSVSSTTIAAAWERVGATNRWKMFDAYVNSQTVADDIDVTIGFGRCDTLVLLDVQATDVEIEVVNDSTGEVVFSEAFDMRLDQSASWADYFFAPAEYKTSLIVSTPLYYNASARIRITNGDDEAMCGHVVAGRAQYIAASQWSPTAGITDYSSAETDTDGVTSLEQGPWSKELSVDLLVPTASVSNLQRRLASYRGKPCVWDCNNDSTDHDALIVYGYFSDFSIVIAGPTTSSCSLTIQGLI